jgi:hypothetical protein
MDKARVVAVVIDSAAGSYVVEKGKPINEVRRLLVLLELIDGVQQLKIVPAHAPIVSRPSMFVMIEPAEGQCCAWVGTSTTIDSPALVARQAYMAGVSAAARA